MSTGVEGRRLFGTDGIRGRAGEGWMAQGAVTALGKAVGSALADGLLPRRSGGGERGRILLGHDGRRSGPGLESALARGLAEAGRESCSAGLITTPGLAWLCQDRGFDLAAMISASHNPAQDNGIKLFAPNGEKLSDATELEIERRLLAMPHPAAGEATEEERPFPVPHDPALEELYLEHLLQAADGLKLDGLAIALDCANGGGSRVGPRLLGRLGAQVLPIACAPDGDNINENSGSTRPEGLQETVRMHQADLGIALDGDGDRCILVDERCALVHGDGILTLLALHAGERLAGGNIVATVMSNRGLHRALRRAGIGVVTVGVGDRQVVEALKREGLDLGGEQSGHVVFGPENGFIGDGLYTALRVLAALRETGRSLSELAAPYRPFPQVLINVPVARKPRLEEIEPVAALARRIEGDLGDDGRVLLRYSGTEPLARVMVEGPDDTWIREQARELAAAITAEIGAEKA